MLHLYYGNMGHLRDLKKARKLINYFTTDIQASHSDTQVYMNVLNI